jgi:hypothetical protein
MAFWHELACKHNDLRLEDKTVLLSPWTQMSQEERDRENVAPWMFRQTVVLTFICNKCGAFKTRKETHEVQ